MGTHIHLSNISSYTVSLKHCFCFVALQQENPNASVGNKQSQDQTQETANLVREQY